MDITSLQGFGTQNNSQESDLAQALGKDDFLNLLVTQLENQDPLNPTNPTEFTGQLAQFSSLEQLYNINEGIDAIQSFGGNIDRLSALALIDKDVISASDVIQFDGQPVEVGFRFDEDVREATISLKNEAGQVIHQMSVDQPPSGEYFMQWDGTGRDGSELPEGKYKIQVTGVTLEGEISTAEPLIRSRISGVDFSGPESILLTDNGKVTLSEIIRVNNSTAENVSEINE